MKEVFGIIILLFGKFDSIIIKRTKMFLLLYQHIKSPWKYIPFSFGYYLNVKKSNKSVTVACQKREDGGRLAIARLRIKPIKPYHHLQILCEFVHVIATSPFNTNCKTSTQWLTDIKTNENLKHFYIFGYHKARFSYQKHFLDNLLPCPFVWRGENAEVSRRTPNRPSSHSSVRFPWQPIWHLEKKTSWFGWNHLFNFG